MSINKTISGNVFNRKKSQGFTLLEAMIGFFILSIGMLGIASLQGMSLKAGKTSVYGAVASMKVEELFESMRANPESLSTYAGTGANNSCSGTKDCTAVELADDDVRWRIYTNGGSASTEVDDDAGTVAWGEDGDIVIGAK